MLIAKFIRIVNYTSNVIWLSKWFKLKYSKEDDSLDWKYGQYVQIGKACDHDEDRYIHNHSLKAISLLIQTIEMHSDGYDIYYDSHTSGNLGDFMFYIGW